MYKKIWIIKVGSSILTKNGLNIDTKIINTLASQIKFLKINNIAVILVSSGAIASGMSAMAMDKKPNNIHKLQALASIGQMDLIHHYQKIFKEFNLQTSQILLTNENLINKKRYDNIYSTLIELLSLGVVPIVNENDTVSFDEIKFGDNDNLAALLSNLIKADKLIIITDQQGLFDKNPSKYSNAKLINIIAKNNKKLENFATSEAGTVGTGGMFSKIKSAQIANCNTHIVGINDCVLNDIYQHKQVGTLLK